MGLSNFRKNEKFLRINLIDDITYVCAVDEIRPADFEPKILKDIQMLISTLTLKFKHNCSTYGVNVDVWRLF